VSPGHFVEDEAQKLVLPHDLVEGIHEPLDIGATLQVWELGVGNVHEIRY
jgi:hypothetical protein